MAEQNINLGSAIDSLFDVEAILRTARLSIETRRADLDEIGRVIGISLESVVKVIHTLDRFSVGHNVMSNQSIDEMRRAGAIAMCDAMHKLPAIVSRGSQQLEAAEYFAKREAGIAALAEAIGPLPPHAAGAFAAIAEFVAGGEQDACTYNLEVWRPEAAMSTEERAKAREAVFALDCQAIS